jgi:hypothetical protein
MNVLSFARKLTLFSILLCAAAFSASAQLGTRKISAKVPPVPAATPPTDAAPEPGKRNGRPIERQQPAAVKVKADADSGPTYYYEFTQPDFTVQKIVIEHDGSGAGKISFIKRGYGDTVTDPIQVSATALERINNAFAALNFLDSTESYQYEKDYSHLGNATYRLKRDGRERTVKFNWTVNKDAKALADEYRKIANQFIWVFDITLSRENQPLEAPRLLDSLDSQVKRDEISDPLQMVPLLKGLADDERIPLIARNHARKLANQIEKGKK